MSILVTLLSSPYFVYRNGITYPTYLLMMGLISSGHDNKWSRIYSPLYPCVCLGHLLTVDHTLTCKTIFITYNFNKALIFLPLTSFLHQTVQRRMDAQISFIRIKRLCNSIYREINNFSFLVYFTYTRPE